MVLPQPFEFWVWHGPGLRHAPFELKLLMKSSSSGSQDWHTQTYLEKDFNWSHLLYSYVPLYHISDARTLFFIQEIWTSDAILSCLKQCSMWKPEGLLWGTCLHVGYTFTLTLFRPCSHVNTDMCYLQLVPCWPSMHETLSSITCTI